MLVGIVCEQPDRPLPVPELERIGLVLALTVRLLDLEHGLAALRAPDPLDEHGRRSRLERFDRGQAPALGDQTDVGQR